VPTSFGRNSYGEGDQVGEVCVPRKILLFPSMPVQNKQSGETHCPAHKPWVGNLILDGGRQMKKTFVLGILIFTLVSLSWGQAPAPVGVRGLDLLNTCRDAKQHSYFDGLCNGMLYASSVFIREQCLSSGVTFEAEKKVVIRYLENHPAELDQLDLLLIKKALVEAYPCSDKKVRGDTSNATGTPMGQ